MIEEGRIRIHLKSVWKTFTSLASCRICGNERSISFGCSRITSKIEGEKSEKEPHNLGSIVPSTLNRRGMRVERVEWLKNSFGRIWPRIVFDGYYGCLGSRTLSAINSWWRVTSMYYLFYNLNLVVFLRHTMPHIIAQLTTLPLPSIYRALQCNCLKIYLVQCRLYTYFRQKWDPNFLTRDK